jgi:serine/threonine protein kinase
VFQPTTFGNYFLTRRLAVGGMAEVYAAKLYGADGFEKDIVIKQILPQYARDPEFVQSFVAEAKIAVTLSHANVVGIYELGRVDGTYFIAMEYVDGLDVFSMIDAAKRAGETVRPGTAVYIAEEVAKGLDYAHRKVGPDGKPLGLVHRDLSPRNVLISREGEVKILDFGIAKTRSDAAAMPKTRAGVVKGTSGYMSPEQAVGDEIDVRTDVYQLGLLLFELLTGRALFWRPDDEETRNLMRKHEIVPPSRLSPGVPAELDRLVLSALTRDRHQRIQTAHELGALLARMRLALYPEVGARPLGEQISRLMAVEAAQNAEAEKTLPSSSELARTLDVLRTQEVRGRVETIATRTPRPGDESTPIAPASADGGAAQPAGAAPPSIGVAIPSGASAPSVLAKSRGPSTPPRTSEPLAAGTEAGAGPNAPPPLGPSPEIRSLARDIADVGGPKPRRRRGLALAGALLVLGALAIVAAAAIPTRATTSERRAGAPQEAQKTPGREGEAEAARAAAAVYGTGAVHEPEEGDSARGALGALGALGGDSGDPALSPAEAGLASAPSREERAEADPNPAGADPTTKAHAAKKLPAKDHGRDPQVTNASPLAAHATVAFGTKSCSSRVSVDGRIVARSTPFYDFKLAAGRHRIMIEGTSCPPVERPGSLRATLPTVVKDVEIAAGTTVKIIADFEQDKLLVRN